MQDQDPAKKSENKSDLIEFKIHDEEETTEDTRARKLEIPTPKDLDVNWPDSGGAPETGPRK